MARNKMLFRITAWLLALVLCGSVAIAPAKADAEPSGKSIEFKLSEDGVDISAKAYVDLENMVYAIMGSVGMEDVTLLDAALYLTQDCLLLGSETVLDQNYGIYLPEATEKLPQSIFAPDSGSAYALSDETYQSVLSALASFASVGAGSAGAEISSSPAVGISGEEQEKMEEILTRYELLLSGLLMQNMKISMEPETIQVGAQSFDTTCVAVKLEKEALCNLIGGFLEAAAGDPELKEVCVILLEQLRAGSDELDGKLGDMTGEEAVEALWAKLPDIQENVIQGITQADVWICASANMEQTSNAPVRVFITVSANGESYGLRCSMGESLETSDKIELEVLREEQQIGGLTFDREADGCTITATVESVSYVLKLRLPESDGENWEADATLLVKENSQVKDFYSLGIQISEDEKTVTITGFANGISYELSGRILEDSADTFAAAIALVKTGIEEGSQVLALQLDKQNNQYTVQADTDGELSVIQGYIKEEEDCTVITIDAIDGQPIAASIILRGTDAVTVPGSYAEILDMDEESFGTLALQIQQLLQFIG